MFDRLLNWFVPALFAFVAFLIVGTIWFAVTAPSEGVITGKHIEPAHYNTAYVMTGKVIIPIVTFVPERHCITISKDGRTNDIGLGVPEYEEATIGTYWKQGGQAVPEPVDIPRTADSVKVKP